MTPNFVVDDAMVADFKEMLKTERVKIDEDGFKKDEEFIQAMIRYRIDEALFGIAEAQTAPDRRRSAGSGRLTEFGEAQKLLIARATTLEARALDLPASIGSDDHNVLGRSLPLPL